MQIQSSLNFWRYSKTQHEVYGAEKLLTCLV